MDAADNASLDLHGAHWSFAVELYQRPQVSAACLALQDQLGVDVCLLLFALFVAKEHGTLLERDDLESLDATIVDWRREVILPLRSMRRRLKTGPEPAPASATDGLLQRIKGAEIEAEQIELAALARHFDKRPRTADPFTVSVASTLDEVVAFFATRTSAAEAAASPQIRTALETLTYAAEQP
jgi:uncharacterized protein (TIGR02444 family)